MNWHTPTIDDLPVMQKCAVNNSLMGNNYSAVNSFLYSIKYSSQISITNNWIFEKYIVDGKEFYSFPHNIDGDNEGLADAIALLGDACCFRNFTAGEKELLMGSVPATFAVKEEDFIPAPQFGDYIYLTENLANLPGSKYSKKRNHINQFEKKYPDYHFEFLTQENLYKALEVEKKWLGESDSEDLLAEKKIIEKAFENFDQIADVCGMTGGIIFVRDEPIAFCLASTLSRDVTDIHFEKCIAPFDRDGAYAIINREFAKTIHTKYLNREEDLGIEGLRKAKLSYYPEMVLEKFILGNCLNSLKVPE